MFIIIHQIIFHSRYRYCIIKKVLKGAFKTAEEKSQTKSEIELLAAKRAKQRSYDSRWNLDIAIFAFAVLAVVIIMGFQDIGLEIVAPVAAGGLALVWLCGWTQGRKMYRRFYAEELLTLKREVKGKGIGKDQKSDDDTIEDMIQKVIKERYG